MHRNRTENRVRANIREALYRWSAEKKLTTGLKPLQHEKSPSNPPQSTCCVKIHLSFRELERPLFFLLIFWTWSAISEPTLAIMPLI